MKNLIRLISSGSVWLAESAALEESKNSSSASKALGILTLKQASLQQEGSEQKYLENLRKIKTAPATERSVPFDIPEIDSALAESGLIAGSVHEWFSDIYPASSKNSTISQLPVRQIPITQNNSTLDPDRSSHYRKPLEKSFPPFALLSHIAAQSLKYLGSERYILWIGRDCWPSAFLLQLYSDENSLPLIRQSLFFDAANKLEKIWAIELALRSKACAAVICESHALPFNLSKRFSLAARRGGGLGLLVRSSSEMRNLQLPSSTASTKWLISPAPSDSRPAWKLRLLKKKGVQASLEEWILSSEINSSGCFALKAESFHQLNKKFSSEIKDFYKPKLFA